MYTEAKSALERKLVRAGPRCFHARIVVCFLESIFGISYIDVQLDRGFISDVDCKVQDIKMQMSIKMLETNEGVKGKRRMAKRESER